VPRVLGALLAAALALTGAATAQGAQAVSVYPSPGTRYNLPATQISFRGISLGQIGQIQVTGSASGPHAGTFEADSDGEGASFIPDHPFQRGETVTVGTDLDIAGGHDGTFTFAIARTAGSFGPMTLPVVPAGSDGVQRFRSRPDLQPAAVVISHDAAPASQGDIFLAPQFGPAQNGPMILDPRGRLLWFYPIPVKQNVLVTDFREQTYLGQPVLTWWQGYTNHGAGLGEGIIFDRSYRRMAVVKAGNGLQMDLHEFLLTPQGQAWVVAVSPVYVRGIGKAVMDAVVQEIDVRTGLVLFEWHALDHVPTSDSYFTPKTSGYVFDPYHLNSVWPVPGAVVVSMRNTNAVYEIDQSTGRILWQLGGRHSTFTLGNGTSTAFQHDAIVQPDGTVTIFDDGAGPPTIHPYARGIRVRLDGRRHTASLVQEYDHTPPISTNFEGNVQQLSGGDVFMGWGQQPYFSEDDARGRQIFDGHFAVPTSSYRAYRFPWQGQPATIPALAVAAGPDGTTDSYASWNGATTVARWSVLTGASAGSLTPAGTVPDSGFETVIPVHTALGYFQVQALDAAGHVLASSPVRQVGPHLALYGRSAFVARTGTGAIPAGCLSSMPCSISTTVSVGRTVIATTGREALGARSGGLLFFTLTGTGRAMLAGARDHQLSATVTARDTSGLQSTVTVSLIAFYTSGPGPTRTVTQSPALQIVGKTDFVSARGTGGILAGCLSVAPCRVSARISAGGATIATTGREFIGPGELGYVIFTLSAAGQSLLTHASGNQLPVAVTLSGGGATASGQLALVRF
jgi:hypothetical protein